MRFTPCPLLMKPMLSPKVWGGSRILAEIHPELAAEAPSGGPIGEAWELADHPNGESAIEGGPFAGRTFSELIAAFPLEMTGRRLEGRYPLLIKILDAAEDLSAQVHPDDDLAERLGTGDRGKSEFWCVMDRDEGARVLYGLKPDVGEAELRAALESGRVDDAVEYLDLEPGLCLDVPAGTVHALLSGTLVCEIQQSSDTTFRLHDWNRQPPRELHLEQGLLATDFQARPDGRIARLPNPAGASERSALVASNNFFQVEALRLSPGAERLLGEGGGTETIAVCVGGRGSMRSGALPEPLALKPGSTVFLPASLLEGATVRPGAGEELALLLTKPRLA